MFERKAPLVEKIVAWHASMHGTWLMLNRGQMTHHDMRQDVLNLQFRLRRNLFQRPLDVLKAEWKKCEHNDRLLEAAAHPHPRYA